MAVADVHPSMEELTAFTLGTLDYETQASIEAHVAACTSCQERAAVAPGDSLFELVRRVRVVLSRTFVTCGRSLPDRDAAIARDWYRWPSRAGRPDRVEPAVRRALKSTTE